MTEGKAYQALFMFFTRTQISLIFQDSYHVFNTYSQVCSRSVYFLILKSTRWPHIPLYNIRHDLMILWQFLTCISSILYICWNVREIAVTKTPNICPKYISNVFYQLTMQNICLQMINSQDLIGNIKENCD